MRPAPGDPFDWGRFLKTGMAIAKEVLVGRELTILEQPMLNSIQFGTHRPRATVSPQDNRIMALVSSLRATAAMLEERIRIEELVSCASDPCGSTMDRSMHDRLQNLRATIAKVEASVRSC